VVNQPTNSGKSQYNFIRVSHFFFILSYEPINFRASKPTKPITALIVELALAPVIAEVAPIPPFPVLAPIAISPLFDSPLDDQPLSIINSIPDIINIHPSQPIQTTFIPKLYRPPKFSHYRHCKTNIANIHVFHRPICEVIPNAVFPDVMPHFICSRMKGTGRR
jgi:hypothetical protein